MVQARQASHERASTPVGNRRQPATGHGLGLALDRTPGAPPLYRQVRDGLRSGVVTGALGAGTRLPPERELAAALGVDRGTVARAYQELVADGVVEAHPSRGTLVCAPQGLGEQESAAWPGLSLESAWLLGLPAVGNGTLGPDPGLLREITAISAREDVIPFGGGTPGHDLVPVAQLQDALLRGIARTGAPGLSYGPVEGLLTLRTAIAERMASRGVAVTPDEILVTAGAMQGLSLVAQTLIEPGDAVAVEAPAFVGTLQVFGAAGARLIPVPVDGEGMRMDVLERVLTRRQVRLILVQPTEHNPTGATLSPSRRERLVALARRHGVPVLEDDAYGELWHDGPDPRPLKALDRSGLVLYLSTFSKTVVPGLRVGWIAAPAPVIARLALAKQFADLSTGALPQLLLAEFLADGYDAHLTRVRVAYAERRTVMVAGLQAVARHVFISPSSRGGFYLWCRLTAGQRARTLAASAGRVGVALLAGEAFYPRGVDGGEDGTDYLRLSFAGSTPEVIAEGLRRLRPLLEGLPDIGGITERSSGGLRPVV